MRENDSDIREVKGGCCDVKYAQYGLRRSDADAVETDAEEYDKPDGVDGRLSERIDFAPESATNKLVFSSPRARH